MKTESMPLTRDLKEFKKQNKKAN